MTIFLDNRPFAESRLQAGATVQDLVRAAQDDLAGTGRMLIGLRCGEEEVSPDRLENMLPEPLSNFGRLQLISEQPRRVVMTMLDEARSAMLETYGMVEKAGIGLIEGRVGEAMSTLAEAVAVWSVTHESVVKGAQLLKLDLTNLTLAGRPTIEWLAELTERLRDVKAAITNRDHVLLGDILRYEFDGTLQRWGQFLDGFLEHLRALPDA